MRPGSWHRCLVLVFEPSESREQRTVNFIPAKVKTSFVLYISVSIHQVGAAIEMEDNEYASLLSFSPSASIGAAAHAEAGDYSLVTILALAQRLHIDLLPLTWQAALGSLGEGGQSIVKQALVAIQSSLAFKRFKPSRLDDSVLRDASREMIMLAHPAVRNHPFVIALEGICWDIQSVQQIWPVLVFEKSHLGDLHTFLTHNKGHDLPLCDRIALCCNIGIALRDMSLASKPILEAALCVRNSQDPRHHPWRHKAPKRACLRRKGRKLYSQGSRLWVLYSIPGRR